MLPFELVELPQNKDMVTIYIDGRRLELNIAPFIEEHILYVPDDEESG